MLLGNLKWVIIHIRSPVSIQVRHATVYFIKGFENSRLRLYGVLKVGRSFTVSISNIHDCLVQGNF
jgi:hypothetical protein